MRNQANGQEKRRLDFELLRLIAIFFVVFNHTQYRGFQLYQVPGGSTVNCVVSLLLAILCKTAVPLFFLVSGGLLLHREEDIRTLFKKRVLRMALVLVLFSGLVYGFWVYWGSIPEPGIYDFFRRLWSQGISIPYWYLYAYLALLLMLPLLRPMVRAMPDRGFVYLFALHLLYYGILGPVGYLLGFGPVDPDFALPLIERTLFYFLMGYYLAQRFPWDHMGKKQLLWLGIASIVALAIMFLLSWHDFFSHGELTQDFMNSLLCIPVFFLYALCRQMVLWHPIRGRWAAILSALGGCTFGAYLLEGILRGLLDGLYVALEPRLHVLPACLVWVLAVVLSGLGITWLLKRLPGLKKLL